jgi:hypothetical protein
MKVSRLPRELFGVLGVGVEVTDWEPSGGRCSALLTLASSGAKGGRFSGGGGEIGGSAGIAEHRGSRPSSTDSMDPMNSMNSMKTISIGPCRFDGNIGNMLSKNLVGVGQGRLD